MNRSAGPARHGFPLGRKLPLLITALLVVTLATGLAFGYAQARETALVTARERLKLLAQNLSAALGSQSPGALSSRAAVARDPAIGAFLRRQTQPSRVAAASALQPLRRPGEPELPIMLSSPGGRPLLVLGPIPAGMDADALKRTLAPGVIPDSLRFGPFVQLGGRGFFWLVTPVREGGATRGHIAELRSVAGSPSGAQQLRALIGPDIDLFLANTAGGPWVGIDGRVTPWPRGWPFSGAVRYRRHGAERFGHAAAIAGTPWSVVVEEPLQTVLARPADFLRGSSLVALILCLAGAAGAWLLSRTITGPLKQLGISADAIGRGEYARRSTLERSDELGVLAHRFDWMAEQVEMTHEELAAQHETAQGLAMELEEANQELADTQSRLDAALRHGRIGTWTWDVAVTRVWLGNGLMRLLGRAGETLAHCTPTTFLSFFHPDDRPRMQRALDEAVASGQEYEIDARVPCLDGTTLSVEIKGSAERDAEGRVWRVTGACIDVTERRELEA
ncbi:MAG TPA: PAS domain-containing protein, partial [Longimicrobium sp.]|nr:PAS domain-containing protein [Longimicrobium sp.]